jgi:hypothetical protein
MKKNEKFCPGKRRMIARVIRGWPCQGQKGGKYEKQKKHQKTVFKQKNHCPPSPQGNESGEGWSHR